MAVKTCPPPTLTMSAPSTNTTPRKPTNRKPRSDKRKCQETVTETESNENEDDGIEEIDCMDYLSHTEEMRENVQTLLQVSEFYSNLITHHPHERPYDFIDVICGWQSTVPCPTYAASASPSVVKKRKSKTIVDFDRRFSNKLIDDECFTESIRRGICESDTYRYIPGNGRYRLGKERKKYGAPARIETNYTFMPKRQSISDQRLLQRQTDRVDQRSDQVLDYDEDRHVTSNHVAGNHVATELRDVDDPNDKNTAFKDGFHPSPQIKGIAKSFRKKEKTVTPPSEKPQDPNSLLSKAFTDTIMKNFTSKMSAIEEQIRGEANWWAMAAGGANYLENTKGKRSNSLPLDSIKVMPVNKPSLPLRPLQKIPSSTQTIQPKVYGSSSTGPHNTPRYNCLESYILNPLNLEAARPKPTKSATVVKHAFKEKVVKRKSREESDNNDDRGDRGFQASPIGKPPPRSVDRTEKRMEGEPDIIAPVALPELFGKKLEVTVSAQKWL